MDEDQTIPAATSFTGFEPGDLQRCLGLFDANCPEFFAKNERPDYEVFLRENPPGYRLCLLGDRLVGAFGVTIDDQGGRSRLNWIMIDPAAHGHGLGSQMMQAALQIASDADVSQMDIATSQLSIDFFARFGARELRRTADGWGPGMDKVDMELTVRSG